MRLIDADKFRKRIAAAAFLNGTAEAAEKANLFMKLLDMEETAYDVDKVVEQIEKIMDDESIRFVQQSVNAAVRIVKNGGADD